MRFSHDAAHFVVTFAAFQRETNFLQVHVCDATK